jgi:hypothetical protein
MNFLFSDRINQTSLKSYAPAGKMDGINVDMKNDWKTVFPDK